MSTEAESLEAHLKSTTTLQEASLTVPFDIKNQEWGYPKRNIFLDGKTYFEFEKQNIAGGDKVETVYADDDGTPVYFYLNNNKTTFSPGNVRRVKISEEGSANTEGAGDGGRSEKDKPENAQQSILSGFSDAVREGLEAGFGSLNYGLKDAAATTALLMGQQNSAITRLSEQQIASYLVKSTLGIDAKSLKKEDLDYYRQTYGQQAGEMVDQFTSLSMLDTLSGNKGSQFIYGTLSAALWGAGAVGSSLSGVGGFLLSTAANGALGLASLTATGASYAARLAASGAYNAAGMLAEANKSQFFGDFESSVDVNFTEQDVKNFEGYEWEKRVHGTLSILNDRISGVIRALQEVKEPKVVEEDWKDLRLGHKNKERVSKMIFDPNIKIEDKWDLTYLEWDFFKRVLKGGKKVLPKTRLLLPFLRGAVTEDEIKGTITASLAFQRAEKRYGVPPPERNVLQRPVNRTQSRRSVHHTPPPALLSSAEISINISSSKD